MSGGQVVETVGAGRTARTSAPVVVGILGDEGSHRALDWALGEAVSLGAPVHLVRVRTRPGGADAAAGARELGDVLADAVARVGRRVEVTSETVEGRAARVLVRHSADAATVVLGPPTHGAFGSAVVGSTAVEVAARSRCPVVVVRDGRPSRRDWRGVVVGFDGSPAGQEVLEAGFVRAERLGLPLTVLHAYVPPDVGLGYVTPELERGIVRQTVQDRELVAGVVAATAERYPEVGVSHEVLHAEPAQVLTDASRSAETVVVGRRGRAELAGLVLGSVSQTLLRHAACPVLVVPRVPAA